MSAAPDSRDHGLGSDGTEADEVPFAGLRRNAAALAGGLVILLAEFVFLVPDLAPPPSGPPPVELYLGRVVEFLPPGDDVTAPDVRVEILPDAALRRCELVEALVAVEPSAAARAPRSGSSARPVGST